MITGSQNSGTPGLSSQTKAASPNQHFGSISHTILEPNPKHPLHIIPKQMEFLNVLISRSLDPFIRSQTSVATCGPTTSSVSPLPSTTMFEPPQVVHPLNLCLGIDLPMCLLLWLKPPRKSLRLKSSWSRQKKNGKQLPGEWSWKKEKLEIIC